MSHVPTTAEIYQAKLDIQDINTFTRSNNDQFIDSDGVTKLTLKGVVGLLGYKYLDPETFTTGATISTSVEALRRASDGEYFRWAGSLPHTVAPGTNPTSDSRYVAVGSVALANALATPNSTVPFAGSTAGEVVDKLSKTVIQVSHLKALPVSGLVNNQQYSVAGFYAGSNVGGGTFIYDTTRSKADHNGGTIIAPESIVAWDGQENTVDTFLNWSGTGQGCFILIGTKALYASQYVTDSNSAQSVFSGLNRLNKSVIDGAIIYLDIPMAAPSQPIIIVKNDVKIIGGTMTRNADATEYPFWIGRGDIPVNGVTFIGLNLIGESAEPFRWGKQGVYIRRATNTAFIGCLFKNIGDAAIRFAASLSSGSSEGALESRTDGVSVIGCTFEDCTQLTTNNTGANSIVFSGCIFRRIYSVKFTQRNFVKCKPSKLIGCIFDDVKRILEVQGGGNVELIDCTGTAEMLLTAYTNSSTFVSGMHVPYGNIKIKGGEFSLSCPLGNAIYLETTDSPNNIRVENYGNIEISDAEIISLNENAQLLRAHANASVIASMHPNITIKKCKLKNFLGSELVSITNNIVDNWTIEITDNEWDEVQSILTATLNATGNWSVEIINNRGKVQRTTHSITHAAQGKEFKVNDNNLKCSSDDGVGFAFIEFVSQTFGFVAKTVEYCDNKLDFSEHWRSVCIQLAQPKSAGCIFKTGGNRLSLPMLSTDGTLPRPVYVNAQTGSGWSGVLMTYPSYVFGEGRKLRAEGASGLSFGALELNYIWLGKEANQRLLSRTFTDNLGGVSGAWRIVEVYSDGVVKSYGRSRNQTENQFNTYFPFAGSAIVNEPYAPIITPEEDCLPRLVQQISNGFTARFTNLAGQDISPWFRYSVEYRITLNEVNNSSGGV